MRFWLLQGRHTPKAHTCTHLHTSTHLQNLGSDSAPITKVGTAAYVAPEVIHNSESRTMYDGTKADIWSAGVVLFVLLCGRYPFTGGAVDHDIAVSMVANLTQVCPASAVHVGAIVVPSPPSHPPSTTSTCRRPPQASVDEVLLKQSHLSDPCKHFLRRLLSVNPAERISLDQIVEVRPLAVLRLGSMCVSVYWCGIPLMCVVK